MQHSKYASGKKFAATHSVQRNWCIFVNEFEFIACFAAPPQRQRVNQVLRGRIVCPTVQVRETVCVHRVVRKISAREARVTRHTRRNCLSCHFRVQIGNQEWNALLRFRRVKGAKPRNAPKIARSCVAAGSVFSLINETDDTDDVVEFPAVGVDER